MDNLLRFGIYFMAEFRAHELDAGAVYLGRHHNLAAHEIDLDRNTLIELVICHHDRERNEFSEVSCS